MTRPPVNIEMSQSVASGVQASDYTGWSGPFITGPTVVTRHLIRQKSGVTRNPKSTSGWRAPSSYSALFVDETPYWSGSLTNRDQNLDGSQYWDTHYENGYSGFLVIGYRSLPPYPSGMEDAAVIKALSQLKNQKVNLAVAFAERAETAELFTSVVTRIAKAVRSFRAKNPKDWGRVVKSQTGRHAIRKDIPERWLEVQYGWKPLMQDVYGATAALNARERDAKAYRAEIKASVSNRDAGNAILLDQGDYGSIRGTYQHITRCKVHLSYVLENPVLATLAQLGITNPAELLWEKLPYSFVIDWASPIGNYLSAFDAALGWQFLGGSCTKVIDSKVNGKSQSGSSPYRRLIGQVAYSYTGFAMDRTVYDHSPLPRFPGLKNPLSTGHIANAMSLLVSAFR